MALLFFWIRVAIKRILNLSKPYILFTFCAIIFIGAFVYAFITGHININLDLKTIYIIVSLMILLSLVYSFRNYNLIQILIKYSKSRYQNKTIIKRYLLRTAFVNNLFLILFNIIAFYSINKFSIDYFHIFILLGITIVSMILSFITMLIKNMCLNNKNSEIGKRILNVNPLIKSAIYDYLSSDFLVLLLLCVIIFIFFIINVSKDINSIYELKDRSTFFIMLSIVFSVGFTGIIGSIPNINWKFQAIVSPNSFKYHLKRTFLFLFGFFGWFILLFIIFGSFINIMLAMRYLYCIFVLFFIAVNISLTITNMMIKTFMMAIIIILTMWVSTLPLGFLPILLFPVIISFIKAKNEYREWSLL